MRTEDRGCVADHGSGRVPLILAGHVRPSSGPAAGTSGRPDAPYGAVRVRRRGSGDWARARRGVSGPRRTLGGVADPSSYRPRPGEIPTDPGVYRFRDAARPGHLRRQGQEPALSGCPRTSRTSPRCTRAPRRWCAPAASVEWTVVATEVEALQLEYTWIKEFDPRFNVKYRDDKSYPYLAVTLGEEFPRALVHARRQAARACATSARTRTPGPSARPSTCCCASSRCAPAATGCSSGPARSGRPCLLGLHRQVLGAVRRAGRRRGAPRDRRGLLRLHGGAAPAGSSAAGAGRCARPPPSWTSRRRPGCATTSARCAGAGTQRRRAAATAPTPTCSRSPSDELEAAVQVFHVRGGRVRGQRGWVVRAWSPRTTPSWSQHLLMQVYGGRERATACRGEVLVPVLPADVDAVAALAVRGCAVARCRLRVPQRGDKRALAETVTRNAQQALARHKIARAGRPDGPRPGARRAAGRARAGRGAAAHRVLRRLATCRAPTSSPRWWSSRTGCRARPSTGGSSIRRPRAHDDTSRPMHEVLDSPVSDATSRRRMLTGPATRERGRTRRRGRQRTGDRGRRRHAGVPAGIDPETGRPRRFAYPPQLVVVDGGLPQVDAAQAALDELGITDVAVVGLAKRLEEVWLPGEEYPGHPAARPARRCTCCSACATRRTGSRSRSTGSAGRKAMTASALDGIPGLGTAPEGAC